MAKLHRRNGTYYALIHVPTDLVEAMGRKRQIWRSLETKEFKEAKRRHIAVLDQWAADFDSMRRRRDLTDADISTAVWEHYTTRLDEGDLERVSRPTAAVIDTAQEAATLDAARLPDDAGLAARINAFTEVEILANKAEWASRRRVARLNRLRADLASGDTRLIEIDADRFLAKHGFKIDRAGSRYRDLCFKLMRADIEQLERYAERDRGDFTGSPKDPLVKEPQCQPEPMGVTGESIMALFARYEAANPNDIRPETFVQSRRDVQHFADFVGPRIRATKIEKRMVSEWIDALNQWPVKASETAAFQGLAIREVIQANKAMSPPKPTITRNTVRRYLASLGGFCRWLARNGYLAANPVADMLPRKNGPANARSTFTVDALRKLFSSPLFVGCRNDEWRAASKPGNVLVRDHRFWIPLVMAFSGARPAEVAQLHAEDVRKEDDVWLMDINDDGEGQRTKTESSKRLVPIHSELVRLGFVEHCQKQAAAGHKQVFPEVEIPKEGQIAAQFSREMNRYLADIGVKTGKDIVVYSLRHTVTDRLRDAGYMNSEIEIIVGHEKRTMTASYGIKKEGTIKRRVEMVERIAYPGLDLSHLR